MLILIIFQATTRYHNDIMEGILEVLWQRDRLGGSEGQLAVRTGRVAIRTRVPITRHMANHTPPPNA